MSPGFKEEVRSRKVGAENAIVVQVPTDRFMDKVQPHRSPPVDEQGLSSVMLLVQACTRCVFGDDEAGPAQELHVWLQVGSSSEDPPIENADVMLPSQHWLALIAATSNPLVATNLRSFGLNPLPLASVDLQSGGGSVELQEDARLDWSIAGPGRGPATIGVYHTIYLPDDEPDAAGNRVAALISNAVMAQPGELRVHGSCLEPYILPGERLPALVHSMPKLEADVVWRRRFRAR